VLPAAIQKLTGTSTTPITSQQFLSMCRHARCSYRAWHVTGQREVPFGVFIVVCNDTTIASETCEELFTPDSPSLALGLNGAEIIAVSLIQHRQLMQRF